MSHNHFGVTTNGRFRVRAVSANDWSRAERIELRKNDIPVFDIQNRMPAQHGWQNANLKPTGWNLERAMPSSDTR